ncbi:CD109 antigen [Stigmatopora argus]
MYASHPVWKAIRPGHKSAFSRRSTPKATRLWAFLLALCRRAPPADRVTARASTRNAIRVPLTWEKGGEAPSRPAHSPRKARAPRPRSPSQPMERPKSVLAAAALLAVVAVAAAQQTTLSTEASYLLLVPQVLRAGRPTSLSVTVLTPSEVTVTARLLFADAEVTSRTLTLKGGSTQMVTLPPVDVNEWSRRASYVLEVTGHAGERQVFSNKTRLYAEPGECRTAVHTDKDVYGAGQLLRITAVGLRRDLRPCNGSAEITIQDSRGNLLRHWRSEDTKGGVLSREMRLTRALPLGLWTVGATVGGASAHKYVRVHGHAAPRFKVTLDLPEALQRDHALRGSVAARYESGQPVSGRVNVTVWRQSYGMEEIYQQQKEMDGSADLNVEPSALFRRNGSLAAGWEDAPGRLLKVVANVTEGRTGVVVGAEAHVRLLSHAYHLYFVRYPKLLKPSMSFAVAVYVCKSDERPLSDADSEKKLRVRVRQRRAAWPDEEEEMELAISADGVASFRLVLANDTQKLTIHASLGDSYRTLRLYSGYTSPTGSYVQVQSATDSVEAGSPFTLYVDATFPFTRVHYAVKSEDGLVAAGEGPARLTLVPEASWAPAVTVLVFLVREDGEVLNDAIRLDVLPYPPHRVSVSWSRTESRPGERVTLRVSAQEAGALVGVMVQDKLPWWAQMGYRDAKVLMERHQYEQSPEKPTAGHPLSLFTGCHLVPLTDAALHPIEAWMPSEDDDDDYYYHADYNDHPEADYGWAVTDRPPETWIWTETFTDHSKSAELTVTVPDQITTWSATAFVMSHSLGLGVVHLPARLSVSEDVQLSVRLPPVVTRGEEVLLEVLLFNNLHRDLQVSVAVVKNVTFQLALGAASGERRMFLGAKSSASFDVPIRPLVLGHVAVTVRMASSGGTDAATADVLVKAEGEERSFSSSLLLEVSGSLSEALSFSFPDEAVAGSQRAWLTLSGDLLGPSIQNLDSLIRMPYGCGEQNMIHFAPNVYALLYLNATGQDRPDVRDAAVAYMTSGYVQELSYRREDGSFSAFGERDASGSTWLTAFVLRCFLQARPFVEVDRHVLATAASWLAGRQASDGAYLEPGRVIHTELQGGLDGPASLAAYVLVALLEDAVLSSQYGGQVAKALSFLEARLLSGHASSNYSLSLTAYALAQGGSARAHEALDRLMGRAGVVDGVPTWTSPDGDLARSWQPSSADVETASYALLSSHRLGRLEEGAAVAKWLGRQRNPTGGFGSTQDTVVALQALAAVAASLDDDRVDLNVSVGDAHFRVDAQNHRLLQTRRVEPEKRLDLQVEALGRGLALLQLNVEYNVWTDAAQRRRREAGHHHGGAFDVRVELADQGYDDSHARLDVCCRLRPGGVVNATGMALAEVGLLSGFSLSSEEAPLGGTVKKVEAFPGKAVVYFDSVTTEEVCVSLSLLVEFKVAKVREAPVSVYDYYQPRRRSTAWYSSEWREDADACQFCGDDCRRCTGDGDDHWTTDVASSASGLCPWHLLLLVLASVMPQVWCHHG